MNIKNKRRLLSMLLCIVMLTGMLPLQAFSEETTEELPELILSSWVNPGYDIEIQPREPVIPYGASSSVTYHSTVASAAKTLKAQLLSRTEDIQFGYLIPVSQYTNEGLLSIGTTIFDAACKHNGISYEGDYLRYSCCGWGISAQATGSSSDGTAYKALVTLSPVYGATASQELVVTDKVTALLQTLSPAGTDYAKLKTVYDWMCSNIVYDYDTSSNSFLKHSTYAAVVKKKAVCQGYALLLYRLALEMGIDCRIITGTGNGGAHAWNIIELEDKYYNLDSTWDAIYHQAGYSYSFFLRNDNNFADHIRDSQYSTGSFYSSYPMAAADYNPSAAGQMAAPTINVTNVASSGKPKISWSAVSGAAKYEVYRATSKTGTYSRLSTTSGTSLTNTSTDVGKTYYYKVRSVSAGGTRSGWSNIVSRTCDLPRPTVSVTNVASTGKIKLSWDKVSGAEKYEVYRATSKDGTYSKLSTVTGTSLTNTSTTAGKTYYYKVRAIHSSSAANSAYSSVVYRTCDLPRTTVSVTNIASSGKIKLSWDAVEGAVSYQVYRSTDGGDTYTLLKETTSTSLTNTSTTAGKSYHYKVRAVHATSAANSAYSAAVSRTCDLAKPTLTVKLNSSGDPKLSWTKIEGADKYNVYRSTDAKNWSLLKTTTGVSLTNTSVTAGVKYYYRVRAIHSISAANSAYSYYKSITAK